MSTPVCFSCNSSLLWPRHSLRKASPPATPTLSPVYRNGARPQPSSSAGARTGRTGNPTCSPPSTLPRRFRPTSTYPLRMRLLTAKIQPSIPPPELASLAPVAVDTTRHFSVMFRATTPSTPPATTARSRRSLTGEIAARQPKGTATGSSTARPHSGDCNRNRQPGRGACHALCRCQTCHHRLR